MIAREIYVKEVGAVTAREQPDVGLVGLGPSSEHALELISEIVREPACPVIAILFAGDPAYVHEAAKRGVFAYIIDGTPGELQTAIDITLQRFAEYQNLQGAFGRRALIEQAKGILMARLRQPAESLRRVRKRKMTLVTMPSSQPKIAVTRMIQTSDWRVEPTTQLTSTLCVLAMARASRITRSTTRAPAQV